MWDHEPSEMFEPYLFEKCMVLRFHPANPEATDSDLILGQWALKFTGSAQIN